MSTSRHHARVIFASTEANPDLLWKTHFFVGDPVLWWQHQGKDHLVLNSLEIDRARRVATVDRIWTFDELLGKTARHRHAEAQLLAMIKKFALTSVEVPENFPASLVLALQRKKIRIKVVAAPFFPERLIKSEQEQEQLAAAVQVAETGLKRGLEVLAQAKIGRDRSLLWHKQVLTSETLRGEIDAAVVKAGGIPSHTIVAGGDQACDPHERGSGPLRAHEAIVIDIFPRHATSGFYGDLTRTVVKGRASDPLRKLYQTVQEGKAWVMGQMKSGVDGKKLHDSLVERFRQAGYPTEQREGRWVGFFHGTGHGLGLEIHEPPRFGAGALFSQLAITVEPGLYYPGIGGVRLEDVVIVGPSKVRNLTTVEETLEIE